MWDRSIAVCASSTMASGAAAVAAAFSGPSTVMIWCATIEIAGSGPISVSCSCRSSSPVMTTTWPGWWRLANAEPTRP
jgi:hypothetical protein